MDETENVVERVRSRSINGGAHSPEFLEEGGSAEGMSSGAVGDFFPLFENFAQKIKLF
jgi:hypothetical protein